MKAILISLALVFTGAFANSADLGDYEIAPKNRVQDYVKAVRAALAQNPAVLEGCYPQWIENTLGNTTEVLVHKHSGQPLLIFDAFYVTDADMMNRMVITTDETRKHIVQVVAEVYRKGEANSGDLANPVIGEAYILQQTVNCTKTPQ